MYFTISCDNCKRNLRVPEDAGGRRLRCPHCSHVMQIPNAEDTADQSMDELTALSQAAEVPAKSPSEIRRRTATRARTQNQSAVTEQVESPQAAAPRPRPSLHRSRSADTDGTNVSALKPAIGAVLFTIIIYLCLLPFRGMKLGDMFFIAGMGSWVPPTLVFFLGWALCILFFKYRLLNAQKRVMILELLPLSIDKEITPNNVTDFEDHVRRQPADPRNTFLLRRVLRGLEHFKVRKSNTEVAEVLRSQSDIDANAVDASYTLLKVFIWAIPILGFIGTVIGISEAVSGFSGTLEAAKEMSALKSSLNSVVGGLATAFDTTLVALVMSIFVMFPTSSLQKAEEDLINAVDSYCNENLLNRLDDGHAELAHLNSQVEIERAIASAMAGHHGELRSWSERVQEMSKVFNEQVETGWKSIHDRQQSALAKSVTDIQDAATQTIKGQQHMIMEQQQLFDKAFTISEQLGSVVENRAEEQVKSQEAWAQALNKLSEQLDIARRETNQVKQEMELKVEAQLDASVNALERLNQVMATLGDKQVIVQQVEASRTKKNKASDPGASQTGSDSWGSGGGSGGSSSDKKGGKGWFSWLGLAGN